MALDLVWIKGHADETGNEYADYLAKEGSQMTIMGPDPKIPVPYCEMKKNIKNKIETKWQRRWEAEDLQTAKGFLTKVEPSCNKKVRKYSTKKLNQLAKAISGHGLFSAHIWHWRNVDPVCKLCKESAETSLHLWSDCPALEKLRLTKNSLFMCNRTEEVEYTRIDLYNDVIFYFNSPQLKGLIEMNEELLESTPKREEENAPPLDYPGTEEEEEEDDGAEREEGRRSYFY